jgi:hypothetical protein
VANINIATPVANDMLDVIAAAVDAGAAEGYIELRSGTKPVNADTSPADGALLATFTLEDPSFAAATARAMALDASPVISSTAVATGTASWARAYDSDDNVVFDGGVGTSGEVYIIASVSITSGQTVNLTVGSLSLPA